ncbi:MAG TPA: hypothetical protein DCM08_09950 [Microscillaceae bacterium]|jgi:ketosteroid isomerase-like protein|nr:hypothetical protein [Microscillaceae bacterium]
MKTLFFYIGLFFVCCLEACQTPTKVDKDKLKAEVIAAEQAFAQMTAEKGIAEAFYAFAEDNAVIKRENDTLIKGKDNIRAYYSAPFYQKAKVSWSPDFVEVADCGTMAYTYGQYNWEGITPEGKPLVLKGVFHTVWKKLPTGQWRYVWD